MALIGVSIFGLKDIKEEPAKAPTTPRAPGLEAPPRTPGSKGGGPRNHNPDGPAAPGGPVYVKVWNKDANCFAWRSRPLSLYYRDKSGQIHGYQPGEDPARDKAFPALARKLGLVLMTRAERRELHREERARYKAIVKARGVET
jgi:hypothetical protein